MGLLDRLINRPEESRLARLLTSYPPYAAPFQGPPRSWSLDQANANLAYLVEHRPERIATLRRLLKEFDIDVPDDVGAGEPQPLLNALDTWAATHWPNLLAAKMVDHAVWTASSRAGPDIALSMLMDVAILFGEMVIVRRPQYAWSVDLDPDNDKDGMVSFLRPVVQIPAGGPFPRPIMFDFEAMVVGHCLGLRNAGYARFNPIGRPVTEAISGAHEAFYLEEAKRGGAGAAPA